MECHTLSTPTLFRQDGEFPMSCFRSAVSVLCLCMTGLFPALLFGSDWPRWRGPDDTGSTSQGTYPESLNEDTMLWKMPLPGKGCSTPIVVNQTIYVTAPVETI